MNDWEARYQTGQTGWDRGAPNQALIEWLESGQLQPPARILVPGCGRGYEVVELVRRGFEVTGIDIAPSAVSHLKDTLQAESLQAEVRLGDIFEYEPEPFDAIYEQTCLCAINPEHWLAYEDRLHRWLKSGGILYALFMQTGQEGGPPHHCDMVRMRKLFSPERWQWLDEMPSLIPQNSGRFELVYRLKRI